MADSTKRGDGERPKRITTATLDAATRVIPEGRKTVRVHAGFPGLYVVGTQGVKGSIRRSYVFRVMIGGKSTDRGLGSFDHVTLTEARQQAAALMVAVRARPRAGGATGGGLPAPKRSTVPTFGRCAERAFEANSGSWTETTRKMWRGIVTNYLQPLVARRVDQVDRGAVLGILAPLYEEKPAIGRKVRNVIRQTMAWAQAHEHATDNPAGEGIDGGLPTTVAVKAHRKALPPAEVGPVLDKLEESSAPANVKACIRLIAFTGVRSEAARGAHASEFELDGDPVWTIPGERCKRKNGHKDKPHRVPLSAEAVRIVTAQIEANGDGLLFPSGAGTPTSNSVAIRVWRRVTDTDIHGLRTSLRSWAAEQGYPREVSESTLGHRLGTSISENSYLHGTDLCEQRRKLMHDWAGFLLPDAHEEANA